MYIVYMYIHICVCMYELCLCVTCVGEKNVPITELEAGYQEGEKETDRQTENDRWRTSRIKA